MVNSLNSVNSMAGNSTLGNSTPGKIPATKAPATNRWTGGIHDRKLKEKICEIGRRVYDKNFAAANDGNISIRVGENEVLCSPTMICKGFMTPDDLCAVDMEGKQIAGKRKRTSEIL